MFRKLYNLARIEAHLVPDGPLLVVQGGVSLDPTGADLAFVRTQRNGDPTVYLPGSSLKGVLRSHVERLLVTALGESAAEDPFDFKAPQRSRANEYRNDDKQDRAAVYEASCLADRLFGSTEIAGRCRFDDAYPAEGHEEAANRTEIRFGVAIDRAKQAGKNPREQEVVTGGRFLLRGTLENYELWMLGLVLQALADLGEGFIQIGHGKSRGFGTVKIEKEASLRLLYPGRRPAALEGAGAREQDAAQRKAYGLADDDRLDLPQGMTETSEGLLQGWRVKDWDGVKSLRNGLLGDPWQALLARKQGEAAHGQ